jgi:VWFA-related protein
MHRISRLFATAIGLTAVTFAQQPAQKSQPATPPTVAPAAVSNAVVINVVVQDKEGRPIRGLKPTDFHLTEDATPQTIAHVDEHSTLTPPQPLKALAPLPPGMFTDFTTVPPGGPLNILIIDALNTPLKDQRALYDQLQQFVNHADPRTPLAIFGLANHLVLLQDFDSDPAALKSVLSHQLIPRSPALQTHTGGKPTADDANTPSMAQLAGNLEEYQKQCGAIETQLRPQLTLDAFNTLGHYLAALPGRKNVLWFSGSFPLSLSAGSPGKDLPALTAVDQDEQHETAALLSRAQASLYPIDARALLAHAPPSPSPRSAKFSADDSKFASTPAVEHARMTALAAITGGKPFPDANNLNDAVGRAIDAGSNYYAIAYTPTTQPSPATVRKISVELTSSQPSLQLAYDRGYYPKPAETPQQAATASPATPSATPDPHSPAAAYARAAMSRGAPTPSAVLFKVRVLPAAAVTETKIAPGNTLDPSVSPTGPFRNFNVDYVSLLHELILQQHPDGKRSGAVEFMIYVYNTDGRLLNAVGKQVSINLPAPTYQRLLHSAMEFHLQISAPADQTTFLRIAMRDVNTNRFGVVEIPTSTISDINPLELKATPLSKEVPTPASTSAPASSTPPPPSAAPSTPPPATAPSPAPQS